MLLVHSLNRGWHTVTTKTDLGESSPLQVHAPWQWDTGPYSNGLLECPRKIQELALARSLREAKIHALYLLCHICCQETLLTTSLLWILLQYLWTLIKYITQAPLSSGFWLVFDKQNWGQEIRLWEDREPRALLPPMPFLLWYCRSSSAHPSVGKLHRRLSTATSPRPYKLKLSDSTSLGFPPGNTL